MKVSKKPGRPKKERFESKVKNLQPISPETMGDMVKAISSEGREELQREEAACREASKMLANLARREMEASIEAAKLKYELALLEEVSPVKEKAESKKSVLRVSERQALKKELYNALIRSWAMRKKNNPDGWKKEVLSEIRDSLDANYSFYGALSRLTGKGPEVIRQAIRNEYKLLG